MSFFLERGSDNNLALEVQRWQFFLRKQGIAAVGTIDGSFGLKTETATKAFQLNRNIAQTGKLDAATLDAAVAQGFIDRPSNFYDDKNTAAFPPPPARLRSPSNGDRNRGLGCFRFVQLADRPDAEAIVIRGSCDGAVADWEAENIVDIPIPQLSFATGFSGQLRCHRLVAPHLQALFARWDELGLMHLALNYEGAFVPRFQRGDSPGPGPLPETRSDMTDTLSNHAFGSAFDLNLRDNPFKGRPALCPSRGSVRELVQPANDLGFFWGGHFSTRIDGMHFEFADFDHL